MKFGRYLRMQREATGVGLRRMAERVGCSPSYLSRLERDNLECIPSEMLVIKLARALGEDRDDLIRKAGRIPSDIRKYLLRSPAVIHRLRHELERASA